MHPSTAGIRGAMVRAHNQELVHTYQTIGEIRTILAHIATRRMLRDPVCVELAYELERRASDELDHALHIVEQIDCLTMGRNSSAAPSHC